jgi:hypothetical protein
MNTIRLSAALLALVICGSAGAEENVFKEGTKEIGHAVGTAAREVGHGTKKATKEIGKAVTTASRETGHAFRDGAKEVKKAVTPNNKTHKPGPNK